MVATDRTGGLTTGAAIKQACKYRTTGNITLSGLSVQANGTWTSTLTEGTRILVKDQSTATENGIYIASSSAWNRSTDFNGARDVAYGTLVTVGDDQTQWLLNTDNPVIGSTSLAFVSFPNDSTTYVRNTLSVDGSTSSFTLTFTPSSANSLLVVVDGVVQEPGIDYSVTGTTLSFLTGTPQDYAFVVGQIGFVSEIIPGDGTVTKAKLDGGLIQVLSPSNYVVTDPAYGAVGDGSTDDTAAVKAAISAAASNGGGRIIFPQGKSFNLNAGVTDSEILISADNIWLTGGGTITRDESDRNVFRVAPSAFTVPGTRVENFRVYDLIFNQTGTTDSTAEFPMIYCNYVKDARVYNNRFIDCNSPVFFGFADVAGWTESQKRSQRIWGYNNFIENQRYNGIEITRCEDIHISDNIMRNGSATTGRGIYSQLSNSGIYKGNTIYGMPYGIVCEGLGSDNDDDHLILDNTIYACTTEGIRIARNCDRISVRGNQIVGGIRQIYIVRSPETLYTNSNILISENALTALDITVEQIRADNAQYLVVRNNDIIDLNTSYTGTKYALRLHQHEHEAIIEGNYIESDDSQNAGITSTSSTSTAKVYSFNNRLIMTGTVNAANKNKQDGASSGTFTTSLTDSNSDTLDMNLYLART